MHVDPKCKLEKICLGKLMFIQIFEMKTGLEKYFGIAFHMYYSPYG